MTRSLSRWHMGTHRAGGYACALLVCGEKARGTEAEEGALVYLEDQVAL